MNGSSPSGHDDGGSPGSTAEWAAWKALASDISKRAASQLSVGLNEVFGSRANGRFGILMYHRIVARVTGFSPPSYNVQPEHFSEQLTGLLERQFQVWPLSRVVAAAQRGEALPSRVVVLTFDDAYGSVYTQAWPVLKRLALPATLFLATAYLDSEEPFPFDPWGLAHRGRVSVETYRPLRTAECREMAQSGLIEIGSHTHTHRDFRGRPASFRADLSRSLETLRDRFAVENPTFCFPWGGIREGFASDDLAAAARAAGVTCALTAEPEVVTHFDSPFQWGRLSVSDWDTGATLAAKLGGWYSWAPVARRAMARLAALRGKPQGPVGVPENDLIQELPS
jgi:peptidoglycan/xylan/chitin deacetylase (PgdA/CDA1 family)